ncbi:MAG TPA: NUDIX domain-containing protein [Chitinivibrionales bacterium]|nr:NUDIX domain-containing protein [Chitinivibrionales bacterium]
MPRYRKNVCIAVRKAGTSLLLLCHRKGFPPDDGWQFPQGGIREGAEIVAEMKRELREEIGTEDVTVVRISAKQYSYNFPEGMRSKHKNYDGQVQQWIFAEFSGNDAAINFNHEHAEFDAFMWAPATEALKRIVGFKKEVYSQALNDLGLL